MKRPWDSLAFLKNNDDATSTTAKLRFRYFITKLIQSRGYVLCDLDKQIQLAFFVCRKKEVLAANELN